MVRFKNSPHGAMTYPTGFRYNDMASYVTETSSITNPVELGFSYSDNDDESSVTSALTGLTGWTSANGGGLAAVRESAAVSALGDDSENFSMAHSKSKSTALGCEMEAASEMVESNAISAISFDLDGSVEASLEKFGNVIPQTKSDTSKSGPTDTATFPIPSDSPGRGHKSKGITYGGGAPPISPSASVLSNNSNASKKRAPVPQMRDPNMDDSEEDQVWEEDCNYDINPTLMYLVLESRDWGEAIALLDAKGLKNKNDAWNLGQLFGGGKRKETNADFEVAEKRKNELKAQARTWIVRRERNGVLRWRMLPLHAALAFNAPFDVVLRLYHLYPGAVRCRNDQGMLPLHHCFKYGNEDKVMELLLDVFPEANTVLDDRGRLPLACTPNDGSDNERRSNILTLFSNFQVDLALSTTKAEAADAPVGAGAGVPQTNSLPARNIANIASAEQQRTPQLTIEQFSPASSGPTEEGTLGAAPRYTTNMDYNSVTFNAIQSHASSSAALSKKQPNKDQALKAPATPTTPLSKEDPIRDRYAMFNGEDSENNSSIGNARLGLSPIPEEEDGVSTPRKDNSALKLELLALGEKKKKKGGLRKLFGKKRVALTRV